MCRKYTRSRSLIVHDHLQISHDLISQVGTQCILGNQINGMADFLRNLALDTGQIHEAPAPIKSDEHIHVTIRLRISSCLGPKKAGIDDPVPPALSCKPGYIELNVGHKSSYVRTIPNVL